MRSIHLDSPTRDRLAAYQTQRPLSNQERAARPGLLRLFILQYVIFHSLLCLEESKSGEPGSSSRREPGG